MSPAGFCAGRRNFWQSRFFAVSFYPIRHGAEIKPYACDLLAALVLLALAVEWMRSPESSRWWWVTDRHWYRSWLLFPIPPCSWREV